MAIVQQVPGVGKVAVPNAAPKRMTLGAVTKGRIAAPLRVLLYGVEGVGKSSFGAAAPDAIFLGPEDGTANLDVSRFPQPGNWQEVREGLSVLRHETHRYQSIVLDTVDWLEPLCWAEVCRVANVKSIEALSFGKGYLAALDEWRGVISDLDALRREKRMNVILLGHALVKTFKNPEGDDYDRYTLKLHEKTAGLFREWVDELLFANYQTFVDKEKTKDRKGKGVGGTRRMYCARRPAFDAKSRHGLPDEMPLSWEEFSLAVGRGEDVLVATIQGEISTKLAALRELAPEIADKAAQAIERAGADTSRLATILNTINTRIAENTREPE
jgi:hypothetical protein